MDGETSGSSEEKKKNSNQNNLSIISKYIQALSKLSK
jgi:hypothetical protein